MLKIEHFSVSYGAIRAVRDVSLTVAAGEIVAMLGVNGAGKSSILNGCFGLAPRVGGAVWFKDKRIDSRPTEDIVKLGLTLVPEGRRIFPQLSVQANLILGSTCLRRFPKLVKRAEETVFTLFPRLAERRSQLAGSLSGGEQQMLAIGRALMANPEMIVIDEPSLGLAPNIVDTIYDMITDLNKQGITVLLVEQNAELALGMCTRAYLISGGQVKVEGHPDILRKSTDLFSHSKGA